MSNIRITVNVNLFTSSVLITAGLISTAKLVRWLHVQVTVPMLLSKEVSEQPSVDQILGPPLVEKYTKISVLFKKL